MSTQRARVHGNVNVFSNVAFTLAIGFYLGNSHVKALDPIRRCPAINLDTNCSVCIMSTQPPPPPSPPTTTTTLAPTTYSTSIALPSSKCHLVPLRTKAEVQARHETSIFHCLDPPRTPRLTRTSSIRLRLSSTPEAGWKRTQV